MGLLIGSGRARTQNPFSDMWYGVQGDFSGSSYKLKRVGNLDLHRTLPIQNKLRRFVENPDGSVKYYLHPDDSRKTAAGEDAIIDSTDGNVMLEKPEYYFKYWEDGETWTFAISEYPLPGFLKLPRRTCSPWFATLDRENDEAVSGCWLQWDENDELLRDEEGLLKPLDSAVRYRGGNGYPTNDGKYNSMIGMPRTVLNMNDLRARCKNGTHFGAYRIYTEIAWLQHIEYASLHSQDDYNPLTVDFLKSGGLGNTYVDIGDWAVWSCGSNFENITYPFIPCGVTAPLGNNTGRVPYVVKGWPGGDKTVYATSYRGLETPSGYLLMMADDAVASYDIDGVGYLYVCNEPKWFSSYREINGREYEPYGYSAHAKLPQESGRIQRFEVYCPVKDGIDIDYVYTVPAKVSKDQAFCGLFSSMGSDKKRVYRCLLGGCAYNDTSTGVGSLCLKFKYLDGDVDRSCEGFRLCRF